MPVQHTFTMPLGATLPELQAFIAKIRAVIPTDAVTKVASRYCEPSDYLQINVTP